MRKIFLLSCFIFGLLSVSSAAACPDYFTSEWGNTLDMSSPEDINDSFPIFERSQLSAFVFENGIFSTSTTGSDSWFSLLTRAVPGSIADATTRYGNVHPIDPSRYSRLIIRMYTDQASSLQVFWNKSDNTQGWSSRVATSPGWNTYTVNLNTGNWASGSNYSLRVDPIAGITGAVIRVDYIYVTPAGCVSPDLNTAPVLQPDREGGEDHYAAVRGNPANFDSASDAEYLAGHSSASIYPSNTFTDSGGTPRKQDFLQAVNNTGVPIVGLTYSGTRFPIDASRYKIACYTLDIDRPLTTYHSVSRLIWQRDSKYYTTDDTLNRITGEDRYCHRMDTVALEPALGAGAAHPWRNNSNGTGLQLLRFDPLEETTPNTYRLSDFRLAADHESNTQFAIVIGGNRAASVDVQYQKVGGSRITIGTLPAGRRSDVLLWDTSALAEGKYYIYTVAGENTSVSEGPVVVSHAKAQDSSVPVLNIDAPLSGHRFNETLQVAGYALDNIRIAYIEVHLDGYLIDSFQPGSFDARARDAYPQYPYASNAGFDRSIDVSRWLVGSYTLRVTAYDTGGNSTVHTATVSKGLVNLTPSFSPPFEEGSPIQLSDGLQPGSGGDGTAKARLTLKISRSKLKVSASGTGCSIMRLFASITAKNQDGLVASGTLLHSVSGQRMKGTSRKIPRLGKKKKIYFLADCGAGSRGSVKSVNARNFRGRRTNSIRKVFNAIVNSYRPSVQGKEGSHIS